MTFFLRAACALTFVMGLSGVAVGQQTSENADAEQFINTDALLDGSFIVDSNVVPAGCNSCDPCDPCGSCNGGGCELHSLCKQRGQFFVGAEYLNIRTEFSEATAYVITDAVANTSTWEQFNMDYSDSYRFYAGYRLCECGGEIRFTYTDIDTGGSFDSGPFDSVGGTVAITPPLELGAPTTGESITGEASTNIRNYDLGFTKTIPLGTPLCCDTGCGDCCGDCCDTGCGDCCGGCCPQCPAWDIAWSGAIRFANVDSTLGYTSTATGQTGQSVVNFDGVGLRGGVLGRRYIGKSGTASVYLKGDISLLLGDVEHYAVGTTTSINQITSTQVIPVTELEAGVTMFVLPNVSVSGGYLLSAWHDLGHRATYDFGSTGAEITHFDDANLMTLDGFFIRTEAAF